MIFMYSFLDRPGIGHRIVYYSGHGSSKGDLSLPGGSFITFEKILHCYRCSRSYCETAQEQKLLLIFDTCYSGINVDRLNRFHQSKEYLSVEMIAASRGLTSYHHVEGSYLTEEICCDRCCPTGTVCTKSLQSKLSKPVQAIQVNKGWIKIKW